MTTPLTDRQVTAEELLRLPDDGFRYELVRGELRKMTPAGFHHGAVIMNVSGPLVQHVKAHALGVVCGAETGFRIGSNPDTVLAPDVAFVRRDRLPPSGLPAGYWPGAPDLAVEVLSPSDTVFEVDANVAAWIESGTGAVWVVNPQRPAVTVHRAGTAPRTLSETATLTGDDIVGGFQMLVSDIFAIQILPEAWR